MQWKQVKDEIPPLNKPIILGHRSKDKSIFEWNCVTVKRPYDINKMYNENYYTYRIAYCEHEWPLPVYYYWAEVEEPTFFVEE